jgi:outer membrane protein
LKAAFDNVSKRYELGAANSFELRTAENSLALAELELIRSKYDYIFRLKILDYYEGREIQF